MKIVVFCYDFPHAKTQEGLFRLFVAGIKVDMVFAAPRVKVATSSTVRLTPQGMSLLHPRDICARMDKPYLVTPHKEVWGKWDLGVILGARILPKKTIDKFSIGILNMHPGMLPTNRGLDNVLRAVLLRCPQGVTAHLINEKVDAGLLVARNVIPVYEDDTPMDVSMRLQNKEMEMLVEAINLASWPSHSQLEEKGSCAPLTCSESNQALIDFDVYLKEFA